MKGDNDNEKDNKAIIAKIAKLRVERSHLLGYDSFADFVLERTMAKTPEKVYSFLSRYGRLQHLLQKLRQLHNRKLLIMKVENSNFSHGTGGITLKKSRRQNMIWMMKLQGHTLKLIMLWRECSMLPSRLYGLEFTRRTDIPKYHPDVNTFEVTRDGKHIGITDD